MRARRTLVVTLAAGALLLPSTTAHAAPPPPRRRPRPRGPPARRRLGLLRGPDRPRRQADRRHRDHRRCRRGRRPGVRRRHVAGAARRPRRQGRRQPDGRAHQHRPPHRLRHGDHHRVRPRRRCDDYAAQVTVSDTGQPFRMADYIAYYDPAGPWGKVKPSGPLENARVAAAAIQATKTLQHVGSNVTLVGVGDDAQIVGASMRIRDAHNVIVRNLTVADAYDCFPVWDPTDTAVGNWNSAYDNVSVWTSTSVWVDHNTFDDGAHPHSALPIVFGRPFEIARRAARHHARLRPGDRQLQRARGARQDRAHRLVGLPPAGPRPAPGDAPPQPLDRHRPARAARAVRGRARLRQPLHADDRGAVPVLLGRRHRVEHLRGEQRVRAGARRRPGTHHHAVGGHAAVRDRLDRERSADRPPRRVQRDGARPAGADGAVEPGRRVRLHARPGAGRARDRPRRGGCRGARLRHPGGHGRSRRRRCSPTTTARAPACSTAPTRSRRTSTGARTPRSPSSTRTACSSTRSGSPARRRAARR